MNKQLCIGCGLETEKCDGPTHKYLLSSSGCWAKYCEILAREYQDSDYFSAHALTVDAYALQHPGVENPQTISSAWVHLASLYCYFELKTPISELANSKQKLISHKNKFNWLDPPQKVTDITVVDILKANSAVHHCKSVINWAEYVYDKWQQHHAIVAGLF